MKKQILMLVFAALLFSGSTAAAAKDTIQSFYESEEVVTMVQKALEKHGYNWGKSSGVYDKVTKDKIEIFRTDKSLTPGNAIDEELFAALGIDKKIKKLMEEENILINETEEESIETEETDLETEEGFLGYYEDTFETVAAEFLESGLFDEKYSLSDPLYEENEMMFCELNTETQYTHVQIGFSATKKDEISDSMEIRYCGAKATDASNAILIAMRTLDRECSMTQLLLFAKEASSGEKERYEEEHLIISVETNQIWKIEKK